MKKRAESPKVAPRETPVDPTAERVPTPGEQQPTSGVVAPEVTAPAEPISTTKGESQQITMMQEHGVPKGAAIQLLNYLGFGVQTYDLYAKKQKQPR